MEIDKLKDKDSFTVLYDNGKVIKFIKEKTDPVCLRASIGGNDEKGYYCTYRADNFDKIRLMLARVLQATEEFKNG